MVIRLLSNLSCCISILIVHICSFFVEENFRVDYSDTEKSEKKYDSIMIALPQIILCWRRDPIIFKHFCNRLKIYQCIRRLKNESRSGWV